MLLRSSLSLLAALHSAYALRDASPFFMLSTEGLDQTSLSSQQLSISTHIEGGLEPTLATCGSDVYIVVEHPGLHATDLRHDAMPKMRRRLGRSEYKTTVQIPEVAGDMDATRIAERIGRQCGVPNVQIEEYQGTTERSHAAVISISQPALTSQSEQIRREIMLAADANLDSQLHSILGNDTRHTIVYVGVQASTHVESLDYDKEDEPPFHDTMHTDLKRDVVHGFKAQQQKKKKSDNPQDGLPLFEKYQFLTPGIFMGLSVSLLLFAILYIGVSAIAGLEVSYMSFSKEMGPQAQKKQQ